VSGRDAREQARRRELDPRRRKEDNERIRRRWHQIKVSSTVSSFTPKINLY
jgi:hypothetical protein